MSTVVAGIVLIGLGVVIAFVGDKEMDPKGGRISKLFSMPPTNAKALKWGGAVSLIAFGVVLMLDVGGP